MALFLFADARRGKTEVLKGYALMYEIFRLTNYKVAVTLVDGDRAGTLSDVQMVQRATGRTIRSRIASFHDGRLIEYRGFTDSFDSVEQALGREMQL